jgi:hypothetical protein
MIQISNCRSMFRKIETAEKLAAVCQTALSTKAYQAHKNMNMNAKIFLVPKLSDQQA